MSISSQGSIRWQRQADGQFVCDGHLPKGTRRVRIAIDGRIGHAHWQPKQAVKIVESAIVKGQAKASEYALLPISKEADR